MKQTKYHALTHMQPLGPLCRVTPLDLHPLLQIADYRGNRQTVQDDHQNTAFWPLLYIIWAVSHVSFTT